MNLTLSEAPEARRSGRHAAPRKGVSRVAVLIVAVLVVGAGALAAVLWFAGRSGDDSPRSAADLEVAQADVRAAVTAVNQCYVDNGNELPPRVSVSAGTDTTLACGAGTVALTTSTGVSLDYMPTGSTFTITATTRDGGSVTYDSATGQLGD